MEKFRKLGIIESVLKSINEENFEDPTEIQEKAIPLALSGKDVIAQSATGSGKTLVFGARIIECCEKGKGLQALVLTPTRELADQDAKSLKKFSKHKSLNMSAIYGGVSINPQFDSLRNSDVVVGTPGRILDHINRNSINLNNIKILVLDEADRMLDMGFIDDVERIIKKCPGKRQTLLFSATISPEVEHIAQRHMKNTVKISAECYVDPTKLAQVYFDVPSNLKFSLLVHLLKSEKSGLVMIFCNTQQNTDFVAKNLRKAGIDALAIHGGFSQAKRSRVMERFYSQNFYALVCTDIAARGLDIKGVSHIYNYDIPRESKQYIHRIGRTARAGEEGKAISILSSKDYDNFSRILKETSIKIVKEQLPFVEKIMIKWDEKPHNSNPFRRHNIKSRSRHYY